MMDGTPFERTKHATGILFILKEISRTTPILLPILTTLKPFILDRIRIYLLHRGLMKIDSLISQLPFPRVIFDERIKCYEHLFGLLELHKHNWHGFDGNGIGFGVSSYFAFIVPALIQLLHRRVENNANGILAMESLFEHIKEEFKGSIHSTLAEIQQYLGMLPAAQGSYDTLLIPVVQFLSILLEAPTVLSGLTSPEAALLAQNIISICKLENRISIKILGYVWWPSKVNSIFLVLALSQEDCKHPFLSVAHSQVQLLQIYDFGRIGGDDGVDSLKLWSRYRTNEARTIILKILIANIKMCFRS